MNKLGFSNKSTFFSVAPISISVLVVMTACFLLDVLISPISLYQWGYFAVDKAVYELEFWRFITAPFVHQDGRELFGSLLFFVFIAPILERAIPRKVFVNILLLGSAVVYLVWSLLAVSSLVTFAESWPLYGGIGMGASIAAALFMYLGNQPVSLLVMDRPFLMKHVLLVYAGVWMCVLLIDFSASSSPLVSFIADVVAITGAVGGWWFTRGGFLQSNWLPSRAKKTKKKSHKNKKFEPKIRPRTQIDRSVSEVDQILDKISAHGFQSLTEKEKKILEQASKNS